MINAWLRGKVYSYLFCIHTFVWFSDSSLDLSTSAEHVEANSSNMDQSLRTPFTGDLGVISNRSSIVSQVIYHSIKLFYSQAYTNVKKLYNNKTTHAQDSKRLHERMRSLHQNLLVTTCVIYLE